MKKIMLLLALMLSVASATWAQAKKNNPDKGAKPYLWGVATSSMAIEPIPNAENFWEIDLIVTNGNQQYAARTVVHAPNDTLIASFKKKSAGREFQAMFTPIDSLYIEVHGPECHFQVLGSARDEGYTCLTNWRIVPKGTGLPFGANVNFSEILKNKSITLFEFSKCVITGNAQFFDVEEFDNSDSKYAYGENLDLATGKRRGLTRPLLFLDTEDTMYLATKNKAKEADAYFYALPVSNTMVLAHEKAVELKIKGKISKEERKKLIKRLNALKIAVKSHYWLPFGFEISRGPSSALGAGPAPKPTPTPTEDQDGGNEEVGQLRTGEENEAGDDPY